MESEWSIREAITDSRIKPPEVTLAKSCDALPKSDPMRSVNSEPIEPLTYQCCSGLGNL